MNGPHRLALTTLVLALVLCLPAILAPVGNGQPTDPQLPVHADLGYVDLSGHLQIWTGPQAITAEEVLGAATALAFRPLRDNVALGYTPDDVWVKLHLTRGEAWPTNLSLVMQPMHLDVIDVYQPKVANPRGPGDFALARRGDHRPAPLGTLTIAYTVALVPPPAAAAVDIYIRLQSSGTMAFRGWLADNEGLQQLLVWRAFFASAVTALVLSAGGLGLIFWLALRRRYFFSFSALMFSSALLVLTNVGIATPPLAGLGVGAVDIGTGLITLLVMLADVVFISDVIEARRRFPRAWHVIRFTAALITVALVATLFGHYRIVAPVCLVLTLVVFYLFLHACVVRYASGIGAGALPALLGAASNFSSGAVLVHWMVVGDTFQGPQEYAFWITLCPFSPLFVLSLVRRAQTLQQRRRTSASLRLARRSEHAARALVAQRTRELRQAKETAEAALDAERAMQSEQLRFIDVVRHQYHTPLAVVRTTAATLLRALPVDDGPNRDRVRRIEKAVQELVGLFDVTLNRRRTDGAALRVAPEATQLGALIVALVARARQAHGDNAIELRFADAYDGLELVLDGEMIGLALANLIENAVKFSPPRRAVQVDCAVAEDRVTLTVTDAGIGVPENELADLSKRYFRASNTGGFPGTGLGLHIVRTVAEAHGGRFDLANNPSGGVTARMILPAVAPGAPGAEAAPA